MKKTLSLLLCLVFLLLSLGAVAETAAAHPLPPKGPVRPDASDTAPTAQGVPELHSDRTEAYIGESFYLSWYEPEASWCVLYLSVNGGEFVSLGYVDNVNNGYEQSFKEIGLYTYCLMTVAEGQEWQQSNFVDVNVTADEDTVCEQLKARGMNNTWNLLFMVYRTVKVGGYERSFTAAQISAIKYQASRMKYTLEGLSDGRMKVGSVDLIVVDEPVTSVTNVGYELPGLSYGPGKDVDFNYIFDHKDISLVAVFAPLLDMDGKSDWLGLGGGFLTYKGHKIYTVILSEIYTDTGTWSFDGKSYPIAPSACGCVHEMLHAVETNSGANGWSGFEALHDFDKSGYDNTYENGNYPWYRDLMRNTIKNGNQGFYKQSFYVSHYGVSAKMAKGFHTDYDGVMRYYINGIPYVIDVIIPANTKKIGSGAFAGISGKSVYIPASVKSIADDAFGKGITVYGYTGSAAETWAKAKGYTFIQLK